MALISDWHDMCKNYVPLHATIKVTFVERDTMKKLDDKKWPSK